ncbi:MAG: hypothetical protein IT429_19510 [Gemmataceae bacterium]|nr:hypothetical protein [Gemmataceae bacterium]
MRRRTVPLGGMLAALLLLAPAPVLAEPLWLYSWSGSSTFVASDDGVSGNVSLIPVAAGPFSGSVDDALAVQLQTAGLPDAVFTNQPYTLKMQLTDMTSATSQDLTFAGTLSGTLNNLTTAFANQTATAAFGGNHYTVTVGGFVPPPEPGKLGSVVADVIATGNSPPVSNVPEPTGLVLAGLGLSVLGAQRWMMRRRNRGVAVAHG